MKVKTAAEKGTRLRKRSRRRMKKKKKREWKSRRRRREGKREPLQWDCIKDGCKKASGRII